MLRLNSQLTDYEEIFAYGDTPEDFAMLALATTQIYRWEEAPPCG
ncbi:TPA: phosphoserine phosphatase [Klebsiella quasipneumoniae subsp. quasipneumoniae]|nr:phosphoserine phosphatase [Klebsiella quasipneumoniae]